MRIRSIKPDFWKSEKVASLPPMTRLLFIGLWNMADDAGRFRAHPSLIQGEIFPYDPHVDVGEHLRQLAEAGLVQVYEVEGRRYGLVVGFAEHQKIDKRTESRLPPPPPVEPRRSARPTRKSKAPAAPRQTPPIPADSSGGGADDSAEHTEESAGHPERSEFSAEWSGLDRKGGEGKGKDGRGSDSQTARGSALLSGDGVETPAEYDKANGAASMAAGLAAARRVRA